MHTIVRDNRMGLFVISSEPIVDGQSSRKILKKNYRFDRLYITAGQEIVRGYNGEEDDSDSLKVVLGKLSNAV